MKRRSFIKQSLVGVSAVFLAGCSAPINGEQTEPVGVPTNPEETDTPSNTTKTETKPPQNIKYVVDGITTSDDEGPLKYSAEIIDGGYSNSENPVQIKITLTNPTDETYSYRDGRKAFFVGASAERTNFTLYPTNPDNEESEYTFTNGCWSKKHFFGMDSNLLIRELKPGESYSEVVTLATPPKTQCPNPQSELTFTTTIEYSQYPFASHKSGVMTEVSLTLTQE